MNWPHFWTIGVSHDTLCIKWTVFQNILFHHGYHGNSVFSAFGQKDLIK